MTTSTLPSFIQYCWKDPANRKSLLFACVAVFIQLSIFKYIYPMASFIHGDSFSYLAAAYRDDEINTYMIGYSRFLRIFSVFTKSDLALVTFQYLLIEGSALFFLFTIFYFYHPRKVTKYILLVFMIVNPLFLYLANLISSDCLFAAASLAWFTLLLWILHRPGPRVIVWHAIVLFVTFTVRYNALIYPFISAFVICISAMKLRTKMLGLTAGITLCAGFVFHTCTEYNNLTGIWQYSPFSGWQMANNAMYAYRYVNPSERQPVDPKYKKIDNMIRSYFDSTRDVKKFPFEAAKASTFYMWSLALPLYVYRDKVVYRGDTLSGEFKRWASMGPFYTSYGLHIINKYPLQYLEYFIWPNANKYYAPPTEYLGVYNSDSNYVLPVAKVWFDYKSTHISPRIKSTKITILEYYPILSGIMNVIFLFSFISYFIINGLYNPSPFRVGLLLTSSFWLINAAFTIFASSAALRFQAFPIIVMCTFAILLVEYLYLASFHAEQIIPDANMQSANVYSAKNKNPSMV